MKGRKAHPSSGPCDHSENENASLVAQRVKSLPVKRFHPWVGKTPWRREWQPTHIFLPGKSHGQMSLGGYSPRGCKDSHMNERLTHILVRIALVLNHCPSTNACKWGLNALEANPIGQPPGQSRRLYPVKQVMSWQTCPVPFSPGSLQSSHHRGLNNI